MILIGTCVFMTGFRLQVKSVLSKIFMFGKLGEERQRLSSGERCHCLLGRFSAEFFFLSRECARRKINKISSNPLRPLAEGKWDRKLIKFRLDPA